MTAGLRVDGVGFAYDGKSILCGVDLDILPGEMVGLLGPNGSGKTTLIKVASGVLKPAAGQVRLNGADMGRLDRKTVARSMAVVPQQFSTPFAFTAKEIVMLGRFPFVKTFAGESAADHRIAEEAMELVGLNGLRNRRFDELSGGERQKVILAMALAQQPELLLLDEPTLNLDINHQVEMLELVKHLNQTKNLTVVAAMHDLNFAALYFRRLVLLKNGRIVIDGTPAQVLTETTIREVYGTRVRVEEDPVNGGPHVIVLPK